MKILQILLLISLVLYMIFKSVNIMDDYSAESREQFKTERNDAIFLTLILLLVLYACGAFSLILPSLNIKF